MPKETATAPQPASIRSAALRRAAIAPGHDHEQVPDVLRVVLGDDSYLAREGIARVLEAVEDVELVASCDDLESVLGAVEQLSPDVVLTDIRMPPTHSDEGIRIAAELRESHPRIGVVVLSQHAEPAYAIALLDDGSAGRAYLLKERLRDRSELSRAVREVAAGGSVVDPRVVDELLAAHRRRNSSRLESLTPRELEVLGMIAEGRSNRAIAEALVVTTRAVERHINAIFSKLDLGPSDAVHSRVKATLIYLAGRNGT